jgi:hypothetical protein
MASSVPSRLLSALLIGSVVFFAGGCDIGGVSSSDVTLSGRVLNAATQNPVAEAVVTLTYQDDDEEEETTVVTDEAGRFSTTIEIRNPTPVTIQASKRGNSVQTTEQVSPDLNEVADIELALDLGEGEEAEPGRPTNITLAEQSTDVIRVQESGGEEVARLTFQVVDSTGTPIELDQAVPVNFRFSQQPGDATLTPESEETDGNGTATVNVASGKTAGIVQVVAETEKADGSPIRSKPVRLSIHGGLPNKCHFTVAAAQSNFAGLTEFNLTNSITAIVGDKYGNPVVPGTAVYFSTNAGLIGGSTQTGENGTGSVTLTSARPRPSDGVATVQAHTVGTDDANTIVDPDNCPDPAATGNENELTETVPVVFSGRPQVEVNPTTAELGQTYNLTVWDAENNNPLAPGTSISVEAEGTQVQATGNTDVTLGDTSLRDDEDGNGFTRDDIVDLAEMTEFTFRIAADPDPEATEEPAVETVTITISGPNGELEIVLTPSGQGPTSTQTVKVSDGATVESDGRGTAIIQAPSDR